MKIIEFLAAIILGAILFPIGILYNLYQMITLKLKYFYFITDLLKRILIETYDIFELIAVKIDILGNIIVGRLFVSVMVLHQYRFKTLFGKSGITISASFGHSLEFIYLNEKGLKFTKILDKILGKNHCKNAYKWHLIKESFNTNNKTGIS